MRRGAAGRYEITSVAGERVEAFLPEPLPPVPALVIDGPVQQVLEPALLAVGRLDDVIEVSNYVAALGHGLARLMGGFPLSSRLIREIHGVLLSRGRGSGKDPGEFRRSQNWIGGSRPGNAVFVPPPPDHVAECMAALERFRRRGGSPRCFRKTAARSCPRGVGPARRFGCTTP